LPRRHLIIPDTQSRPGVPDIHLEWIGRWAVEHKPDVIVHMGDHWDLPSLSAYDAPGSMKMEGARYEADVEAGNAAFAKLNKPIEDEIARLQRNKDKTWRIERHFLFGNHEQRIERAVNANPKFAGTIGYHHLKTPGWTRHNYLERLWLDGLVYSHFFQSPHSSYAIGGTIDNRLNKIGASFVQGHEQGIRYGTRIQGSGANWHGLVAGSCYLHDEGYRGAQGQGHFRGIVVLNEVEDGDYCVMPLTLDYLCRKYEGVTLGAWLRGTYKDAEHRFTLARKK
jgi:hypothetical protein